MSIPEQGIHYFVLDMTNNQGQTFSDTVAVLVEDEALLDDAIKQRWNEMKAA